MGYVFANDHTFVPVVGLTENTCLSWAPNMMLPFDARTGLDKITCVSGEPYSYTNVPDGVKDHRLPLPSPMYRFPLLVISAESEIVVPNAYLQNSVPFRKMQYTAPSLEPTVMVLLYSAGVEDTAPAVRYFQDTMPVEPLTAYTF